MDPSFQVIQHTTGLALHRKESIHPSRAINYSFHSVSFQHGYKTKAFSWNCGWNRRKALPSLSNSSQQNTCRGFLSKRLNIVGTWLAEVWPKWKEQRLIKWKTRKQVKHTEYIYLYANFYQQEKKKQISTCKAKADFSEHIRRSSSQWAEMWWLLFINDNDWSCLS